MPSQKPPLFYIRQIYKLGRCGAKIFCPSFMSHIVLDTFPDCLYYLPVSPSSRAASRRIPFLQIHTKNTPSPTFDGVWWLFASPTYVDTHSIPEQVRWIRPFVALKLPSLPSGKHSYHPGPVLWLELLRSINNDETNSAHWIDRG